jgi:predicted nucleic acid-binding Zn ribbon protein
MMKFYNLVCPICRKAISFKLTKDETICTHCERVIKLRPEFLDQNTQKIIFGLIGSLIIISTTLLIRYTELIEYVIAILGLDMLIALAYYAIGKIFYFNFQRVEVTPPR